MASIIRIQPATRVQHLSDAEALGVLQRLHRHLEPAPLVAAVWGEARALCGATGLRYHDNGRAELRFGRTAEHRARWHLDDGGDCLGLLTFAFATPVDDAVLAHCSDLVALAMPALRNALCYDAVRRAAHPAGAESAPLDDTLLLVSLDAYEEARAEHGDVWAQTLIESLQQALRTTLRGDDSIYQIEPGVLAVLLPRTGEPAVLELAARVRRLVADLSLRDGGAERRLTACMGVAEVHRAQSADAALERARRALQWARAEGAGTLRVYRPPLAAV